MEAPIFRGPDWVVGVERSIYMERSSCQSIPASLIKPPTLIRVPSYLQGNMTHEIIAITIAIIGAFGLTGILMWATISCSNEITACYKELRETYPLEAHDSNRTGPNPTDNSVSLR